MDPLQLEMLQNAENIFYHLQPYIKMKEVTERNFNDILKDSKKRFLIPFVKEEKFWEMTKRMICNTMLL